MERSKLKKITALAFVLALAGTVLYLVLREKAGEEIEQGGTPIPVRERMSAPAQTQPTFILDPGVRENMSGSPGAEQLLKTDDDLKKRMSAPADSQGSYLQ